MLAGESAGADWAKCDTRASRAILDSSDSELRGSTSELYQGKEGVCPVEPWYNLTMSLVGVVQRQKTVSFPIAGLDSWSILA